MSVELELELRNLKLGDHACLLFDGASTADDWATIVPFVKEGLSRGERCHLIVDDADRRAKAMHMLSSAGVDAELEVQRRALTLAEQDPRVFAPGRFDPRAQIRVFEAIVDKTLAKGFRGFRLCSFVPPGDQLDERWLEFECLVNDLGRSWKAIMLCRHDMRRSSPAFLREVLRVHRKAVLGPLVCPCTYYEPPDILRGEASDADRLRWMIEQLCSARLAQRALERAVQARDDFLSAASHELRTPLTSALLDLEGVMRAAQREPDEHGSTSSLLPGLRRMKGDFQRFVEVVQRLVDASQLREEKVEFHLEPVDLREATRCALDRCADVLRRARCEATLTAPDESVVGRWDRMRVEQMITSLVENAAKFGENRPIGVEVSRSDGVARLVVSDHGIGIRREDLPRVFERFEQGVPVSHYGGFGLGLWIASTIVDAFGGRIAIRSEPGKGTTVTVELPTGQSETQHALQL
jgi:signal transduction histidine kinase